MTFFIVLFIVLMQFLWRYIDDLVGKGLEMSVIAELFFYAAVTMVPMALPLAILLASLMTFGNFGEKFELTAMKASGVSLLHAMRPLIVLITFVSIGAFFFQNNVLPTAQVKMWTLLFSMRQKSPEVEIPEGVFYDQIPGYNLFVQHKDRETGMLYNMMIYDVATAATTPPYFLPIRDAWHSQPICAIFICIFSMVSSLRICVSRRVWIRTFRSVGRISPIRRC